MIFRKENDNKFNTLKYYKLNRDKDKYNKLKEGQNLKSLQGIIKQSNSILDDYTLVQNNHNYWRRHGYKDDVMKIKTRYWDKYNVDRFLKNKQKMEMNQNIDNTPLGKKKLFSSLSSPDIFNKTKF